MSDIKRLRMRATALMGSPPPGDARATARVIAELCEHVETTENAITELIRQLQVAKSEIAALQEGNVS